MFDIQNYKKILEKIDFFKKNTQIVAVSKNHPKESVEEALNHGVRIFGENRVQEAKNKFESLKKLYPDLELHLTGPLQTNKTKDAISLFDVFHTLDREKLAREFVKHGNLENKKFFIQVNTGREKNKSGIFVEQLNDFVNYCRNDLELNTVGLMCIPPIDEHPKEHFSTLEKLARENNLSQLSMGMSSDYIEAIKHNATYVRIGTSLFGVRKKWKPI